MTWYIGDIADALSNIIKNSCHSIYLFFIVRTGTTRRAFPVHYRYPLCPHADSENPHRSKGETSGSLYPWSSTLKCADSSNYCHSSAFPAFAPPDVPDTQSVVMERLNSSGSISLAQYVIGGYFGSQSPYSFPSPWSPSWPLMTLSMPVCLEWIQTNGPQSPLHRGSATSYWDRVHSLHEVSCSTTAPIADSQSSRPRWSHCTCVRPQNSFVLCLQIHSVRDLFESSEVILLCLHWSDLLNRQMNPGTFHDRFAAWMARICSEPDAFDHRTERQRKRNRFFWYRDSHRICHLAIWGDIAPDQT